MIVTGLFGALSINQYRWGYYLISCLFFLVVLWGLFSPVARVRSLTCFHGALRRWWLPDAIHLHVGFPPAYVHPY